MPCRKIILPARLRGSGRDVVLHHNPLTTPDLFDAVLVGAIWERGEQAHDLERTVASLEPDTLTDLEPVRHLQPPAPVAVIMTARLVDYTPWL